MEVARLTAVIDANTAGFTRAMRGVDAQMAASGATMSRAIDDNDRRTKRFGGTLGTIGKAGALAIGGIGLAAGGALTIGLVSGVRSLMAFDSQMSKIKAVTGASTTDMEKFRQAALDAGTSTKFSATEAAMAQVELGKAGMTTAQILGGGFKSALALAAAGEMDLADAAMTTSNVMGTFGIAAKDTMHIADALAVAANQTTADVGDFALAFQMGGSAAKLAGMSFDEATVALMALAKIGVRGSDAGTSLKAALTQIAKPTDQASEAMEKYNLAFFKADGSMKSVSQISAMLRKETAGLTKQQRLALFSTIAGTDGMRTLAAMYASTPKEIGKYNDALAAQGTASEQAKTMNDNLGGAFKQMMNSINVVTIELADALKPALLAAVGGVTQLMQALMRSGAIDTVATAVRTLVASFNAAGDGGKQVGGVLTSLRVAFASMGPAISALGQMAQKVGPALGQYLGAALQTIGRIAAVALPIVADGIEKIGPPLARIATQMLKFSTVVVRILGEVIPPVLRALAPVFSTVFSGIASILNMIAALMEGDFSGAFRHGVNAVKTIMFAMPKFMADALIQVGSVVASKAAEVGASIVRGIADGISSLPGLVKDKLTGMMDDALNAVKAKAKIFSPSRVWADEVGKPLGQGIILGFLNGAASLPSNVSDTVAKAMERAKGAVDKQKAAVSAVFGRFAQGIMRAFDAETTAGVRRIQERLSAAQSSVSLDIDSRMNARRAQGAQLTPAEAELQRERDAYDARERERNKADAQAALAAAQAEGDARAIADAQRRLDDIAYAEKIRLLEQRAAEERAVKDAATETDLAALETERTQRLAALQRQYDDEQLQYESNREVMRQKREDELARLEAFLTNSTGKVKDKTRELQAFLNRPDIRKAMAQSGTNLGTAFADALGQTRGKVTAAVRALARIVQDYLRLRSPSKLGPLSTLDSWWTAMPDTLLKGVDTSMIGQVAAGIAAPDSGAGFGTGGGGGSAPVVVNVTVQGTVTSERDLVDTIRAELLKTGQRNGSIFGGFA